MTVFKRQHGIFVFIDAENMRNCALAAGYQDFDYKKLHKWLTTKKGVTRVYIYVPIEKGDLLKKQMFDQIALLPNCYVDVKDVMVYPAQPKYQTIICPNCSHKHLVQVAISNKKKGNCDAELTLDIIRFGVRKKYDSAIIFSGDGDFGKVYEYVSRELKRKVIVYAPAGKRTSLRIKELASKGVLQLESANGLLQHTGKK